MDDNTIRVGVGLHLRPILCHPITCKNCGAKLSKFTMHGLNCEVATSRVGGVTSLADEKKLRSQALHFAFNSLIHTSGKQDTRSCWNQVRDVFFLSWVVGLGKEWVE